ncbi:MAG: hypothetical protein INR62_05740, partial [Rhodospirillales bacterium]|nr:hypothetical protein [Acetobacter sp.]
GADASPGSKIIELRELLASRFPGAIVSRNPAGYLATGVESLDLALEGGLTKGALTEIVGDSPGTGSGTLIHGLIASAQTTGKRLALIDGGNSFSPDHLNNKQLATLLWVRCTSVEQALRATDLLLRDGNLSLLVLDLVGCQEREVRAIPSTYWYRLQRVCEENGSTALVLSPVAVVAGAVRTLRLARQLDLAALDLLRNDLLACLQLETVHRRTTCRFDSPRHALGQAVG